MKIMLSDGFCDDDRFAVSYSVAILAACTPSFIDSIRHRNIQFMRKPERHQVYFPDASTAQAASLFRIHRYARRVRSGTLTQMARLPRLDLPGIPQHIVQRGNNRMP